MPDERSSPDTVKLIAVGDVCMGDSPEGVGGGVHAMFERVRDTRPKYPFEHAGPILDGGDLVFGNLEVVLSHQDLVRWKLSSMEMRGHPESMDRVLDAGFTVLNMANNHSMQHGLGPFHETAERLRSRGVGVVGVATADHTASVPYSTTVKGVRATFLGYAFEPDVYARSGVGYAFAPDCNLEREVTAARQSADVVIVSLHWGVEFVGHPSVEEEQIGRRLIDAGATVVLGHHPHVIRRVEHYNRGIIAYSLGNFVFDMLWNPAFRTGLVLEVDLSTRGVERYDTELVWIDDDFQPGPMTSEQQAQAIREFRALHERPSWVSDPAKYDQALQDWIARSRYESWRFFLATSGRRPVGLTMQTLWRTARRKALGVIGYD